MIYRCEIEKNSFLIKFKDTVLYQDNLSSINDDFVLKIKEQGEIKLNEMPKKIANAVLVNETLEMKRKLGQRLRKKREKLKITFYELRKYGFSWETINSIENGTSNYSFDSYMSYSHLLNKLEYQINLV